MDKIVIALIFGVIAIWMVAAVALIPAYADNTNSTAPILENTIIGGGWTDGAIADSVTATNEGVSSMRLYDGSVTANLRVDNDLLTKDLQDVTYVFYISDRNGCTPPNAYNCEVLYTETLVIPFLEAGSSHTFEIQINDNDIPGIGMQTFFQGDYAKIIESDPIPTPTNSTTPAPELFEVCHKGKTISVSDNAVDTHVNNHGDTFGACIVSDTPYNPTTSLPDPDYSAVVNPIVVPQYMDICHSNEIIQVNVDSVRYHMAHGDKQFECPKKGAVMFVDTIDIEQLNKAELVSLVSRILTELMSR